MYSEMSENSVTCSKILETPHRNHLYGIDASTTKMGNNDSGISLVQRLLRYTDTLSALMKSNSAQGLLNAWNGSN